jgi:N-acylneuraminate cytidylyltransferase
MNIAVIPARGGSRRIPRKNIKVFCGKPMIAWSIEAAQKSGFFERIVVSTEDGEIAAVSRKYGADVPFVRPQSLSDDFTGTMPVMQHAVEWMMDHGLSPKNVCCLYATAPFVRPQDLKHGLQLLENQPCEYTFSVTRFAFPIQRAIRITAEQRVEMFQPEYFRSRSQDLEKAYHDAGQFYWGKAHAWLKERPLFSRHSVPVVLPRHRVHDIDTLEDWRCAERLHKALQSASG